MSRKLSTEIQELQLEIEKKRKTLKNKMRKIIERLTPRLENEWTKISEVEWLIVH